MRQTYATIASVAILMVGIPATFGDEKDDERVWGDTVNGVALSIAPAQQQYTLGQDIHLSVLIRNTGKEDVRIVTVGAGFGKTYRALLFAGDGRAVPKSDLAKQAESSSRQPGSRPSRSVTGIGPGRAQPESLTLSLKEWFTVNEEGTYLLIVMRRVGWSWDEGMLVSNVVSIRVGGPDDGGKRNGQGRGVGGGEGAPNGHEGHPSKARGQ